MPRLLLFQNAEKVLTHGDKGDLVNTRGVNTRDIDCIRQKVDCLEIHGTILVEIVSFLLRSVVDFRK